MDDELISVPSSPLSEVPYAEGGEISRISTVHSQFRDPDGDIIIRTSDSVDFRVYKVILGVASPVFKTMFSLPQPAGSEEKAEVADSLPMVTITESSTAFNLLLRLIYPMESPKLENSDVSVIGDVLAASLKYEAKAALEIAKKALRARAERNRWDAIAAYAIACHLKQEDDARATAISCLRWPFPGPRVSQLELMSALDYHALMEFHKAACNRVANAFKLWTPGLMIEACARVIPEEHSCPAHDSRTYIFHNSPSYIPKWWCSSMAKLVESFQVAPFDIAKLSLSTISAQLLDNDCRTCRAKFFEGWDETRGKIITFMKKRIDMIDLELSWTQKYIIAPPLPSWGM